jgi:hypothetical protein
VTRPSRNAPATANGHGENAWESGTANPYSGGHWEVTVPGGTLGVTLDAGGAWLTGPAVIVAEGELDPSWPARAASGSAPGIVQQL